MKFRKKPAVIDAIQWDGTYNGMQEIKKIDDFAQIQTLSSSYHEKNNIVTSWRIKTLEGGYCVSNGDWIIRGIKGEYYPCKPDIFEKTYEPAESQSSSLQVSAERKEMFYQRNIQNPYPQGSPSATGYEKGFETGWNASIKQELSEDSFEENDTLRSCLAIIERRGASTNWEAIEAQVKKVLKNHNPYTQSTPQDTEKENRLGEIVGALKGDEYKELDNFVEEDLVASVQQDSSPVATLRSSSGNSIEQVVKFITGIKRDYPPIDTPCLFLYDKVYAANRHIGFTYAQEVAIRECVIHLLNQGEGSQRSVATEDQSGNRTVETQSTPPIAEDLGEKEDELWERLIEEIEFWSVNEKTGLTQFIPELKSKFKIARIK